MSVSYLKQNEPVNWPLQILDRILGGGFMLSVFSSKTASWRKLTSAVFSFAFVVGIVFVGASASNAQSFSEGFDAVPAPGWVTQNNSVPTGSTQWFQGNTAVFPSQSGAGNSYIGANFNNTTGTNTISNWLVSPNATGIQNGQTFKYWTRTTTASAFPDRLQVRMSLAGASTNVGTGNAAVGDFTTLLRDINPTYDTGGAYPEVWTEFTETITGVAAPTSGRFAFRYFVEMGGPTGDNSNFIGIDTVSYTAAAAIPADGPLDFNGDGKTDYVHVRNVGGGPTGQVNWYYTLNGTPGLVAKAWGLASDFFVSGNWDADTSDDIAIWRPGAAGTAAFYVLRSSDNTALVEPFGQTGDDSTVVEDYNGDGRTDFAVYRGGAASGDQSTWFYKTTAGGPTTYVPWGLNGDFPAPGDYDGNGSADFVTQRGNAGAGNFWTRLSTGATSVTPFGLSTDVIAPGDYDGDGKTDIAVTRGAAGQISWWILPSSGGAAINILFGASATDFIVQGDYDGDGKTDGAVWRPSATAGQSAFWVRSATGTVSVFPAGNTGDYPVANFNTH